MEKQLTRAVIFDMDGLIIDSEPFWRKAEIQGFAEVGLTLTENDCKETMGYRLNEVIDLWYDRQPWHSKSKQDVENRILDLVISFIKSDGKAMPGLMNVINLCKERGLKMAIASSSPFVLINAVVDKLGIRPYFEVIHSAQNEPLGKPHPSVFITTAERLNTPAHLCLVLEDSFHGVIAGLAAKMKVIAVPDAENILLPKFQAAHHVIPSLEQLEENML